MKSQKKELSDLDLKHSQKIMISMMKSIHDICEKHNIKYWLDYGTLIGAVRHNGFIPWDDDFDICMLRKDYDLFDKVAQKELGDNFFWQTYKTDKNWIAFQGKVRLKNTIWMEAVFLNSGLKENGFFIDVFPIDNTFDNRLLRKIHFFITKVFLYSSLFRLQNKKDFISLLLRLIPLKLSLTIGNYLIQIRNKNKSKYVTSFSLGNVGRNLVEKSVFDTVVLHKYEEEQFYIPKDYDDRLRLFYGDYMTPPPLEERHGHHGIVALDFGKY